MRQTPGFPAHAGIDLVSFLLHGVVGRFPRPCGDRPSSLNSGQLRGGSPPTENTFMERLPQRGSVPQIGVFHTPCLRNRRDAPTLSRFGQPGRFTFSVIGSTHSATASKTGVVALGAGISSTDGLCRSLAERWHNPMPHCRGFVRSIPKPPPTPLTAPPPAPAPSEWPFPACLAGSRAAAGCAAPKLAAGPEHSPAASSRW